MKNSREWFNSLVKLHLEKLGRGHIDSHSESARRPYFLSCHLAVSIWLPGAQGNNEDALLDWITVLDVAWLETGGLMPP
jgi:hypothetical protein